MEVWIERAQNRQVLGNPASGQSLPMKGVVDNKTIALKLIRCNDQDDDPNDSSRIEALHLEMLGALKKAMVTPHISEHIASGPCRLTDTCRDLLKMQWKRRHLPTEADRFRLLVAEYAQLGSFASYYYRHRPNAETLWALIFQVLYTLHTIQVHYKMVHGDMHMGNVLIQIDEQPKATSYRLEDGTTFTLPVMPHTVKLWDFELSNIHEPVHRKESWRNWYTASRPVIQFDEFSDCVEEAEAEAEAEESDGYETENTECVSFDSNLSPDYWCPYYDAHLFLGSVMELKNLPNEIYNWARSMYPIAALCYEDSENEEHIPHYNEAVTGGGRLRPGCSDGMPTPLMMLMSPVFDKYRVQEPAEILYAV